ncbi:MAG: TRL-like family protein [Leptospirales bacterium]|nr:TRL-like family protein [Leptospirales bacterium]
MAKSNLFLALSLFAGISVSCIQHYSPPMSGCLYTNVHYSSRDTARGEAIGDGQALRSGRNCTWALAYLNYFWYETGASIAEAMKQGEITRIAAVDYSHDEILGAGFVRECVIVWGE